MTKYERSTDDDDYRSLGTIFKDLSADISTLFRSEIALLKLEVKDTVAKLGGGTAMFAGALFLASSAWPSSSSRSPSASWPSASRRGSRR